MLDRTMIAFNHRSTLAVALLIAMSIVAAPARADDDNEKSLSSAQQADVIAGVMPSLVRVEYTLRFDKGDAPRGGGWRYRCPNCGNYHARDVGDDLIKEERPMEASGFLVGERAVVTADPLVHPRFIESIVVRQGDATVTATPAAFARDRSAIVLTLAGALPNAKPLAFDATAEEPYFAITYGEQNTEWTAAITGLSSTVSVTADGRRFRAAPTDALIVNEDGTPVALSMQDQLTTDDSWKGSPDAWAMIDAAAMTAALADREAAANAGILRVALSFRSPKKGAQESFYSYGDDDGDATERNVLGLLYDSTRILVLTELKPKVTARLERIQVHPPDGDPVTATFVGSLTNYGAFVAELASPLPGTTKLYDGSIRDFRNTLVLHAEAMLQGENRVAYHGHSRIAGFTEGWRQHVFPQLAGQIPNLFLFADDGTLIALPISRREKVSEQERWSSTEAVLTAATDVRAALMGTGDSYDPNNTPLTEEEENRLAWLGVELQALDTELARANNVSDLTRDGAIGALVSYVYPASPAAMAGIEPGTILLRLHVADQPKPIDVEVASDAYGFGGGFPWDRLDELPEQYFDQIPQPWPSVENTVNRSLTDIGFGKAFKAEIAVDGKVSMKDFVVEQSPPHYDAAKRWKSEPLGITVRNLTYEVRRYFQRTEDDPGVLISKIEPGSKASVAGIKPYEIITQVNDEPVGDVAAFEAAMKDVTDLRLRVLRMTKSRIVKITLPASEKEDENDGDTNNEPEALATDGT